MKNLLHRIPLVILAAFVLLMSECETCRAQTEEHPTPLIPATTTMMTAWDIPRNPLVDSLPADRKLAAQIVLGFELFMKTPTAAARLMGNKLSCNNCHLNGGQREKAMPLVGVAAVYPEYNKRAGRLFTLEDRIVGCFLRSQNATRAFKPIGWKGSSNPENQELPVSSHSGEVLALSAYLTWLSQGFPIGQSAPWRGRNVIDSLLPVGELDARRGEQLFLEKCSSCHGEDGQGRDIGDKRAGPLWGKYSWNDGAGAARIYTLAGMIRYAMPYLDPGSLTDEEALQIAAFINSKPRPAYPFKRDDYAKERVPPDAVYYKKIRPK